MRNVYLVAYDVADPKRLRRTYQTMLGHGDPVQYSIFYCELSPMERQQLKQRLWAQWVAEAMNVWSSGAAPDVFRVNADRISFD
jgi:CRISPR-associated endonuclease Cas2